MGIRKYIPQHVKLFIKKRIFSTPAPKPSGSAVPQIWSIGIYEGKSADDLMPSKNAENPVLSAEDVWDVPAHFVADPFMVQEGNKWYMFFEVLNAASHRGEIGLAKSKNGYRWHYEKIIIKEPFHLSYPYVFKWEGDYYMIPETSQTRTIRIYKATGFPYEWEFEETLISGLTFSDASLLNHNDMWWLFTETSSNRKFNILRLYMADNLFGPWQEHPRSPLIHDNPHTARPGGRVVKANDKLVRFAQDCSPVYGLNVRAFEITELTPERYSETPVGANSLLTGSGEGWNESGMHHIDLHSNGDGMLIACVDGWKK